LNLLDWIMIGLAAAGLLLGYIRGFVAQLVSVAGFAAAYIIAYLFYDDLAPLIRSWITGNKIESYQKYDFLVKGLHLDVYISNAVAFALLFFGVKLALVVVGNLLHFVVKAPGLSFLNRWSGALLGLAEALIIVLVGVHVLTIMPSDKVQGQLAHSAIAPHVLKDWPAVTDKINELWKRDKATQKAELKEA
jgi:uncharacterized membrane protein required for colicin V production